MKRFIVFEGLDGSGQSTQAELLESLLEEKGFKTVLTKEPTVESSAGKKIKEILNKRIEASSEALQKLFAEDRKEHLEKVVIPALDRGNFVVSDRYFYSSLAFGASDGLSLEWLMELNKDFLRPEQAFLLKTSPATCISRIEKRGTPKDLFEKEEKLAKVWTNYEKIIPLFEEIEVIDGEKSIEEVFKEVKTCLKF